MNSCPGPESSPTAAVAIVATVPAPTSGATIGHSVAPASTTIIPVGVACPSAAPRLRTRSLIESRTTSASTAVSAIRRRSPIGADQSSPSHRMRQAARRGSGAKSSAPIRSWSSAATSETASASMLSVTERS